MCFVGAGLVPALFFTVARMREKAGVRTREADGLCGARAPRVLIGKPS